MVEMHNALYTRAAEALRDLVAAMPPEDTLRAPSLLIALAYEKRAQLEEAGDDLPPAPRRLRAVA